MRAQPVRGAATRAQGDVAWNWASTPIPEIERLALLWILNLADGDHNLLDAAEQSGIAWSELAVAMERLHDSELLHVDRQSIVP